MFLFLILNSAACLGVHRKGKQFCAQGRCLLGFHCPAGLGSSLHTYRGQKVHEGCRFRNNPQSIYSKYLFTHWKKYSLASGQTEGAKNIEKQLLSSGGGGEVLMEEHITQGSSPPARQRNARTFKRLLCHVLVLKFIITE